METRGFFFSANAKLARAGEHIQTLIDEARACSERETHALVVEANGDATQYVLRLRVHEEPPLLRWSLIAADAVQNMRAALDHAIHGLAAAYTLQNPPPDWESLAFPICNGPEKFPGARWRLGPLRRFETVVAAVEALQPYNREPKDLPLLGILQELNNADKHRIVFVTRHAIHSGHVSVSMPDSVPAGVTRTSQRRFASGPMADGTELYSVTFSGPAVGVKIEAQIEIVPVIKHRPGADGMDVSAVNDLLGALHGEVAHGLDVLRRLSPG